MRQLFLCSDRYEIIEVRLGRFAEFYIVDSLDLYYFEKLAISFAQKLGSSNQAALLHLKRFCEQVGTDVKLPAFKTTFASRKSRESLKILTTIRSQA